MSRCEETIEVVIWDNPETIRCSKVKGHETFDHPRAKEHGTDGHYWKKHAERPTTWRRGGLWLTAGGRVVKPGAGEMASVDFNDIQLMTATELQRGIHFDEFTRRYANAKKKWKRRRS